MLTGEVKKTLIKLLQKFIS